jgi:hypothetical protein
MRQNTTALERAFELASTGKCKNVEEVKAQLNGEGYLNDAVAGRQLLKQLRALIAKARAGTAAGLEAGGA